ncbi:MAG: glycosyltransferase [Bacteroidetes bacterium]|nr:glycosyltransferase [Bacteroidota bacterium]
MAENKRLPVSALVGTCNEAHLLRQCLDSLQWCDEILVVDLESNDHPERMIQGHERMEHYRRVSRIEDIFPVFIPKLKHQWVLLIDPDEVLDPELQKQLTEFIPQAPEDAGRINTPIRYYFKKHALKGTVWGGKRIGRLLIHRERVLVADTVHTAITLKEGFRTHKIRHAGNNVDHHYWMSGWKQLFEKHRRYLQGEGLNMYREGKRYNLPAQLWSGMQAFRESFIQCKGYLDGITGLSLSLFWAWYQVGKWRSLRHYQRSLKNTK